MSGIHSVIHQYIRSNSAQPDGSSALYSESDLPLVSVVIPFHTGGELLRAALHSVLGQTHRQVEVLIVHDSPETDPTPYLPQPQPGGPSITVYCQHARGAGCARNFALDRVRGDYVAFLDADDFYLPTKIENQLGLMQRTEAAICHTSYFVHGANLKLFSGLQASGHLEGEVFPDIISNNPVAMPTVMIRRDIADAHRFPDAPGCEDFLWLLGILRDHPLHATTEPLSIVRITPDSVAYNAEIQARSLRKVIAALESDDNFSTQVDHIAKLKKIASELELSLAS